MISPIDADGVPDTAGSSPRLIVTPLPLGIPDIKLIPPTQMTQSPRTRKLAPRLERHKIIDPLLPPLIKNDLFSQVPLTFLSKHTSAWVRQLFVLHGGRTSNHRDRALLLIAESASDPELSKMYSGPVVVYHAQWIQDSFLAGELLPLGEYVIYPWEYQGEEQFCPFDLEYIRRSAASREHQEVVNPELEADSWSEGKGNSRGVVEGYTLDQPGRPSTSSSSSHIIGVLSPSPKRALAPREPNIGRSQIASPPSKTGQRLIDAAGYEHQPKIMASKRKLDENQSSQETSSSARSQSSSRKRAKIPETPRQRTGPSVTARSSVTQRIDEHVDEYQQPFFPKNQVGVVGNQAGSSGYVRPFVQPVRAHTSPSSVSRGLSLVEFNRLAKINSQEDQD